MSTLTPLTGVVVVIFLLAGLFFTLVSAIGVLRLPDVYSRAHTVSQTDTLGGGFALAAVAITLGVQPQTVLIVLLLFFVFVTNPTAAHAIARAANDEGIDYWRVDDPRDDTTLATDDTGGDRE